MPTKGTPLVCFRMGAGDFADALDARSDGDSARGAAARDYLEWLFALADRDLEKIRWSDAEWNLLYDACNGMLWDADSIRLLWVQVNDAIHLNHLDEKWGVDTVPFLGKLRSLSPMRCLAVADKVRRYWLSAEDSQ